MRRVIFAISACALFFDAGFAAAANFKAKVSEENGRPVQDAIVLASPLGAKPSFKPRNVVVDQVEREFVPYVTTIAVGAAVSFPNRDNIRHSVYSFSPAKQFELPLYEGKPAAPVLFDKPGVVVLGCNIHDWMVAYIYVADTPYFGKTGAAGTVELVDVPPGEYAVRIWHPRLSGSEESTIQRVSIKAGDAQENAWRISLKPENRPRRAPVSGIHSYH
jgi:plastocyanin